MQSDLTLRITHFCVQLFNLYLKLFKGSLSNCSAETKISFYFPEMLHLRCSSPQNFIDLRRFFKRWHFNPRGNLRVEHQSLYYFSSRYLHFFFFLILEDLMKCTEHVILSNMNLQSIHKIFDDCVRKQRNVRDSSAVHISSIFAAAMVSIEKSTMIWFKRWRWLNAKLCGTSLKTIIKQNYYCAHPIPNFQLQRRKPHKFPILHAIYWKILIYKDYFLVVYF